MNKSEIIKTLFLPVSIQVAWGYLTEADKLAKWFHAPKKDLEAGQPYTLYGTESGDKICWGTVTKMEPHTLLAYSFSVKPFPSLVTEVEWHLDEIEGGTRITLHHSGMVGVGADGLNMLMAVDGGWDGHFSQMRAISST